MSSAIADHVADSRGVVENILRGNDKRVIAIVGPCSIHNTDMALEYARQLKAVADEVSDRLFVVMRVYFEKPRTTVGWKGLINDPHLNDTFDIATGLRKARQILLDINTVGLPAATEMLEPITPQYIADLITLASIGARTTESPTHRQMASGLSMPVGFKNSTEGSLEVAINAMKAARAQHNFLGIDHDGKTCVMSTRGNELGHLILRGGRNLPNYQAEHVSEASQMLRDARKTGRRLQPCKLQQGLSPSAGSLAGCDPAACSRERRNRRSDAGKQSRRRCSGSNGRSFEAEVRREHHGRLHQHRRNGQPAARSQKNAVVVDDVIKKIAAHEELLPYG